MNSEMQSVPVLVMIAVGVLSNSFRIDEIKIVLSESRVTLLRCA